MNRGGKILHTKLAITKPLATLEREHNKYIANLSIWDQYIVWTYTLGSQAVNRRLVGLPFDRRLSQKWAYELFSNFSYGLNEISTAFAEWRPLFENPSEYNRLPSSDKSRIADLLLDTYSKNLQTIILNAPVTKGNIVVYKASTPYDERLTGDQFPFTLPQAPFNSTTYDPWFDFNAFLGSSAATCCLWEISIPAGSHVLAIAHPYQAYLTEREILLPMGCSFNVLGYRYVTMSYYLTREEPIRTQQPPFEIGEVYRHDHWVRNDTNVRRIRMLIADYSE